MCFVFIVGDVEYFFINPCRLHSSEITAENLTRIWIAPNKSSWGWYREFMDKDIANQVYEITYLFGAPVVSTLKFGLD